MSSADFAAADTVTFTTVADATLFAESGDTASGADDGVFAGVNGNTGGFVERRALLRFDLSSVPANATVTTAALTLNVTRTNHAGDVSNALYRATASWGEGMSTAGAGGGAGGAATPGSATWAYRFWNTTTWSMSGGDYVSQPTATTVVGAVGTYVWISPQLAADVQSWVQAPASNFGWILIAAPIGGTTAKRYASREFSNPQQRPVLSVTYELPAPADIPLPPWAYAAVAVGVLAIGVRAARGAGAPTR